MQGFDESATGAKNPEVEIFTPSPDLNGVGTITKLTTLPPALVGRLLPAHVLDAERSGAHCRPVHERLLGPQQPRTVEQLLVHRHLEPDENACLGQRGPLPGGTSGLDEGARDRRARTPFPELRQRARDEHDRTLGRGQRVRGLAGPAFRSTSLAATPTRFSCPTARWWPWAAASAATRPAIASGLPIPSTKCRSSSGIRRRDSGRSVRASSRIAPTTRPPSSFPTAECFRQATTETAVSTAIRPRSTSRPTSSRARAHRSQAHRPDVTFGSTFNVDTPNTNITKAVLIAPGAATHAVDMNQRFVPLAVTQRTRRRQADGSCQRQRRAARATTCSSSSTRTECRRSRNG